ELAADYLDRLGPHSRVHLLLMRGIANIGVGEYTTAWEQIGSARALDNEIPCTQQNPFGGGDPAIVVRTYAVISGLALGHVGVATCAGSASNSAQSQPCFLSGMGALEFITRAQPSGSI